MPSLHDFRSNFRFGRVGAGLRVRQDTKPYAASVREADNMMVLSDGVMKRRWATRIRTTLAGVTRIEGWVYSDNIDEKFLLAFRDGAVDIYSGTTLQNSWTITSCPWTAASMRFMTITFAGQKVVISDATFATQVITLTPNGAASSFAIAEFAFDLSDDQRRLRAPFFNFEPGTKATVNIFTSEGGSTSYGTHLDTAVGGWTPPAPDVAAGTGRMFVATSFFTADMVGTRLRLGDGELEITAYNNVNNVDIKVYRDLAYKLVVNPFFFRKDSDRVEVNQINHNLAPGDTVFFAGVSRETADVAKTVLSGAPQHDGDPTGTAQLYTVTRVLDADTYEVQGNVNATADALGGGSDCYAYPISPGFHEILEPAFSARRGWPQAATLHESRLWLAGSNLLPDAAWASVFGSFFDFDTGDGGPDDAIAAYGVGENARILHMVSQFDLVMFTASAELYVPGSTEKAVTQETIRVVTATTHGSAYTAPRPFDGSIFFVDAVGQHVRELKVESRESEYVAPPVTVATPDWVQSPEDTTVYDGSPTDVTPYLLTVNAGDGTMLVMHASKEDDSFGFMRWSFYDGSFVSVASLEGRLFTVASRAGGHVLLEFEDLEDEDKKLDFMETIIHGAPSPSISSTYFTNEEVQVVADTTIYTSQTFAAGSITLPEDATEIFWGLKMPFLVDISPPVAASGQGPKAGKLQRLVSAEVHFIETETGTVNGEAILDAFDAPALGVLVPIDEWREFDIGEWEREPVLKFEGDTPGKFGIRALTMNVYF